MKDAKTVWINLDPTISDLKILEKKFAEKGYNFVEKLIPKDDELTLEIAMSADVILSVGEVWNEYTLSKIAGMGKLIMRYGVGTDNIDIPTATKYNIPIANIPGANSTTVAEMAVMHMLNASRNFLIEAQSVQNGGWGADTIGNELDSKTLGLVGYGNIARHVSRMVSGFETNVLAYDPYVNAQGLEMAKKYNVTMVDTMEELFQVSDIVSLHIPLMESTRGSINKKYFELMKPTAILINTCRGGVVNEPDLIASLEEGKIAGAGVDVICNEPRLEGDPILSAKNICITPHVASNTYQNSARSQEVMYATTVAFLEGQLTDNVLNRKDIK